MRISFRQGVVYAPAGFLQISGSAVTLQIAVPDLVIAAVADGDANYLINERTPVTNAWAGPFSAGSTDYHLYWDINVITGQRTFGHTTLAPVVSSVAPSSPANDQHWFDQTSNKMKVWNSTVARWIPKIRVFAAMLAGGTTFISMSINSPVFTGTQVGTLNTAVSAGPIIFDQLGAPVKRNNGAFFTTEDVAVAGVASGAQVKFESAVVEAVAEANIPGYRMVRFSNFNRIVQAVNADMSSNNVFGMIEQDVVTGEVVNVVTNGMITNPVWDWTTAGVNAPLYISITGVLTTDVPLIPQPVALVVDQHTILLRPSIVSTLTPLALNDLIDVNTTGVQDGDTIVYDEYSETWIPGVAGGASVPPQYFYLVDNVATFSGSTSYGWDGFNVPVANLANWVSYDSYNQRFTVAQSGIYEMTINGIVDHSGNWPTDTALIGTDFSTITGTSVFGNLTFTRHYRTVAATDAFLPTQNAATWVDRYVFQASQNNATFALGVVLAMYNNSSDQALVILGVTIDRLADYQI